MSWDEAYQIEGRLRNAIIELNKQEVSAVTMVEAIDEAAVWPQGLASLDLEKWGFRLDSLIERTPLLVCAVAAEIGFGFEGVGTIFWTRFDESIGDPANHPQRQRIADTYRSQADRYQLSRPSQSAFSEHFSIIAWPIANALLPADLVGPVSRLLARAPVGALPGIGRAPSFASLRAWASAAEGARLVDWLRLEAPATRVLTALLAENRGNTLPAMSYQRLRDAIAKQADAFFSARAARLRARGAKTSAAASPTSGQLALARDATGVRMFVSWPALPSLLFEEARAAARSAAWRPRLWNAGALLHPDMALSSGPFALALQSVPRDDEPAYPNTSEVFGEGSDAAAVLAARTVAWNKVLFFDPNEDRTRAEQRSSDLKGASSYLWIAVSPEGASLEGLRKLGYACGYTIYEADLGTQSNRSILERAGLASDDRRLVVARHPTDAINALQGIVRPERPFLLYDPDDAHKEHLPQELPADGRLPATTGPFARPGLRAEASGPALANIVDLLLFERDNLFEALIERRLQLRIESPVALVDVPVQADLEVDGILIARGQVSLPDLPITVPSNSPLFAPLYDDRTRSQLLQIGKGSLRIAVKHSAEIQVGLQRPATAVDWSEGTPSPIGSDLETTLVAAEGRQPHHFGAATVIEEPARAAIAYGLQLSDGRIADPLKILAPERFELSLFAADFSDVAGSRRMFDHGNGVGDVARALVAWSRGICFSLAAVIAKSRIVRQFEEPLVISLCGGNWRRAEEASRSGPTDAHVALWRLALQRGLVTLPESFTPADIEVFADAFRRTARARDPDWPSIEAPANGAMDDALNEAFELILPERHAEGALLDLDKDSLDFGRPPDEWVSACSEALRIIRRPRLYALIAPSDGGHELGHRSYTNLSVPELAEVISAWTRQWALPRGRMSPDVAASALQLWLSPAACDDVDRATHTMANDPFVARATRYAALRLASELGGDA